MGQEGHVIPYQKGCTLYNFMLACICMFHHKNGARNRIIACGTYVTMPLGCLINILWTKTCFMDGYARLDCSWKRILNHEPHTINFIQTCKLIKKRILDQRELCPERECVFDNWLREIEKVVSSSCFLCSLHRVPLYSTTKGC